MMPVIVLLIFKLNKLIYIASGYYLAIKNRLLFDDKIEAWKYGPVIPSIYYYFKREGKNKIKEKIIEYSVSNDTESTLQIEDGDKETFEILEAIYTLYGSLEFEEFFDITHNQNEDYPEKTPWESAYIEGEENIIIDPQSIKKHYLTLLPLQVPTKETMRAIEDIGQNKTTSFTSLDDILKN